MLRDSLSSGPQRPPTSSGCPPERHPSWEARWRSGPHPTPERGASGSPRKPGQRHACWWASPPCLLLEEGDRQRKTIEGNTKSCLCSDNITAKQTFTFFFNCLLVAFAVSWKKKCFKVRWHFCLPWNSPTRFLRVSGYRQEQRRDRTEISFIFSLYAVGNTHAHTHTSLTHFLLLINDHPTWHRHL